VPFRQHLVHLIVAGSGGWAHMTPAAVTSIAVLVVRWTLKLKNRKLSARSGSFSV
jgi:hypothetical protein